MGDTVPPSDRSGSLRTRRRQFLRTAAITGVSSGILSQSVNISAAEDDPGTNIDEPIRIEPPGGGGSPLKEIFRWEESITDGYMGGKGYATVTLGQYYAESANHSWDRIPIELSGNAISTDDSGDHKPCVTHTESAIHWDNDSADGAFDRLIFAENNPDYIGGYYDGYDDGDGGGNALSTLASVGTLALPPSNLVFTAQAIAATLGYIFSNTSKEVESYSREWDWGKEIQTSWWTKYRIRLDPGESFEFSVGDVIDLWGMQSAIMVGGTLEITMPWDADSFEERIKSRISHDQLSRAALAGVEFPDIYEGLTAYAGSVVKQNPTHFHLPPAEIGKLDDSDVYYRYPVDMSYTGPLPEDFFR